MSRGSANEASQKTQTEPLFTQRQLLSEYSYRIRTWATRAYALALMNGSLFLRDAFAFAATEEKFDAKELYGRILLGQTDDIRFRYEWLFRLGRLIALQNMDDSDTDLALFCLEESTYHLRLRSHRIESFRLQVELLAETGQFDRAGTVISEARALYGKRYEHLSVDITNPFVNPSGVSTEEWLEGFNKPFRKSGLAGIQLAENEEGPPFDRLEAVPSYGPMPDGPQVSVIMTSYAPDEKAFELAARSILNQSWQNLELVVVDDATPGGAPGILRELANDDPRVKVIQLDENRGTYFARNVGLRSAVGQYVTGQDSDDWSHPERIYRQVRALQNASETVGVVTKATRSDDNLFRILRGIDPERLCEVSLMFPADLGREIGGYLESRKGADSEFRLRLELFSGKSVQLVDEPLYLTRLSTGSLSRSDFKRGWAHQNRRAFSNLIKHWHKVATQRELVLDSQQSGSNAIPPKFRSNPSNTRSFEYVFMADWRNDDAETRSALSEVEALQLAGKSVGILQSSGFFSDTGHAARLSSLVQSRINSGEISLVIPDENAEIENLIIRNAEVLQFAQANLFRGIVERLFIIANQPPSSWDGSSPVYHTELCSAFALDEFGAQPVWLAQDLAIHRYLTLYGGKIEVWPVLLPYVLPIAGHWKKIAQKRPNRRHTVIGRHARNIGALWPEDSETVNTLWPAENDRNVEVRTLGDAQCYLEKFDRDFYPNNWVSYRAGDISQDAFYSSIDSFVYFPDANWPQEFCAEALVAFLHGCTVILPPQFETTHRNCAIYPNVEDVPQLIQEKCPSNQSAFAGQWLQDIQAEALRSRNVYVEAIEGITSECNR